MTIKMYITCGTSLLEDSRCFYDSLNGLTKEKVKGMLSKQGEEKKYKDAVVDRTTGSGDRESKLKRLVENQNSMRELFAECKVNCKSNPQNIPQMLSNQFVREIWDNALNDKNDLQKLPAELASLKVWIASLVAEGKTLNELILDITLLHSMPPDGMGLFEHEGYFCAQVLQALINNLKQDLGLKKVTIATMPFQNWFPEKPAFSEGMKKMYEDIKGEIDRQKSNLLPGDRIVFLLTGGFKALSMILSGLAHSFSAKFINAVPIQIAYLHELAVSLFHMQWQPGQIISGNYDIQSRINTSSSTATF